MATRVTKTLDELYIDAANALDPTPTKFTVLDAKIALAEEFDPAVDARNEDQADRVILQAAIDGAAPLPPTQVVVSNGDSAALLPASGTTPSQGTVTAAVAGSVLTGFRLPATAVRVNTAATAPVQNSAGAAIGTGTITVAANAISNIRLPATVAGVTNGAALTVPVTGTYTTTATVTVAGGVVTGIVLS